MLISIGILARNEATRLEAALVSLFSQTAIMSVDEIPSVQWEIIVVPNGCTDQTAVVARETLGRLVLAIAGNRISWKVCELRDPGKSSAWNQFTHHLSSSQAELLVLMDADVVFGEPETLTHAVQALLADRTAVVAVARALKDAHLKKTKTLVERVSLAASAQSAFGPTDISGMFYCGWAAPLRDIWMPAGLSVEDGFLYGMILTDCFRKPIDQRKVTLAPNASYYYRTLTSPRAIFRHELRLVIGTTTNCYLMWDLLLFATDPDGPGAGVMIRNLMANDPNWYPALVRNAIRNHGWWVLPRGMLFRRFSKLRPHFSWISVRRLAIAVIGFLFDLPVFLVANSKLKRTDVIGYW
jgi:glycosyltransferase involved in cell wall biosynthesis